MPRIRRHCQIQPAIKQLPLVLLLMLLPLLPTLADAWQWTDWIAARDYIDEDFYALFSSSSSNTATTTTTTAPLSIEEVADMRVRDIKRRLARQHGYSAQELATMILKKELIEALAFEEEKLRLKIVADVQRMLIQRGIVVAIVAVAIVACWPLIQQAYQVALVNFVVYTDRKKLEAQKCWEFKTKWGLMGVTLMFILDLLQAWLTLSVLLSWVLASASPLRRFLFPTPHIPVRPAQFMGEVSVPCTRTIFLWRSRPTDSPPCLPRLMAAHEQGLWGIRHQYWFHARYLGIAICPRKARNMDRVLSQGRHATTKITRLQKEYCFQQHCQPCPAHETTSTSASPTGSGSCHCSHEHGYATACASRCTSLMEYDGTKRIITRGTPTLPYESSPRKIHESSGNRCKRRRTIGTRCLGLMPWIDDLNG